MHYVSSTPCVKSRAPPPDFAPAFCRYFARLTTHCRGKSERAAFGIGATDGERKGTERGDKNKWNGGASRGAQIRRLDRVGLYDIRVLWLHDSRGRKLFYVAVLCNCGWRHLEVNISLVLDAERQESPLISLRHEGEKVKLRCSQRYCCKFSSYHMCRWATVCDVSNALPSFETSGSIRLPIYRHIPVEWKFQVVTVRH